MTEAVNPVQLVRESFEAFNRGDLDTAFQRFDDDTEVHASEEMMNEGTFHGREETLAWISRWLEVWDEYSLEPNRYQALDDEHVLVEARQTALGKGSGVRVEMDVFWLAQVRDGRTVRLHLYPTEQAARAAAETDQRPR